MTDKTPKVIQKAESSGGRSIVRPPTTFSEKGQPRVVTGSLFIKDSNNPDLCWPYFACTVDNMMRDADVSAAAKVTMKSILDSVMSGEVKSTGTAKSDIATKFGNYSINNFDYGTWREAMTNALTSVMYGFADLNIVLKKRTYGPYANSYCINKLSPRDQKSVAGWVWNKNITEWRGLIQKPPLKKSKEPTNNTFFNTIIQTQVASYIGQNYTWIKPENLLHFTIDKTNDNPQGNSPFKNVYEAWMEKQLISRYQVTGVSKDMGGSLVVEVPAEYLERAGDPNNPEYNDFINLQKDAAALHAGETPYIVVASDLDPDTKSKYFDIKFKGVEGGGKSHDPTEIIEQKRKQIFNGFCAGFMILGQDGSGGSYAMSEDKTTLHGTYVEGLRDQIVDVINNQLLPRLFAANDIFLDYDDMPKFEAAPVKTTSWDEFSKAVQRMGSVNKLTPQMFSEMLAEVGLTDEGIEELDYTDKGESRSGESQGSSGTGNSQQGGSNSATNNENKSIIAFDHEDDENIYGISSEGKTVVISKEE
jgi:hypothetical protein